MSAKLKYAFVVIGVLAVLGVLGALTSSLFKLGEEQESIPTPHPVPRPAKPPVAETVVTLGEPEPTPSEPAMAEVEPEPVKPEPVIPQVKPPEPAPAVVEVIDEPEPAPVTNVAVVAAEPTWGAGLPSICDDYPQAIRTRDAWPEKITYNAEVSASHVKFTFVQEELDPSGKGKVVP